MGGGTHVTLNVDLGELPDEPRELYALATQVNVACGGHAGDERSMREAIRLAQANDATIVAHPSYPDREGFGRRTMRIELERLRASVAEQCAALQKLAGEAGVHVSTMKPHGALYHDASNDDRLARALVGAALDTLIGEGVVAVVGPPGSRLMEACARERDVTFVAEGFADRAYDGDRLRPRDRPGALLVDAESAAKQAVLLARSGRYRTLCVHGDTPGAVKIASAVRAALEGEGLLLR